MSGVQFDEGRIYNQNLNNNSMSKHESGLSGWLVKHHLAKNLKHANIILLILALIFLGFSINIFMRLYKTQNSTPRIEISEETLKSLPDEIRQKIINQNAN